MFDEESAAQVFDNEQQIFKSCDNKNTSVIANEHGSSSKTLMEEEFAMAGGRKDNVFCLLT